MRQTKLEPQKFRGLTTTHCQWHQGKVKPFPPAGIKYHRSQFNEISSPGDR